MSEEKWVKHISGQGEKWEIRPNLVLLNDTWPVKSADNSSTFYLPKSEYIPCPPPEKWKDVTEEVEYRDVDRNGAGLFHNGKPLAVWNGYRLRKVKVRLAVGMSDDDCFSAHRTWAFIVEKKEPA